MAPRRDRGRLRTPRSDKVACCSFRGRAFSPTSFASEGGSSQGWLCGRQWARPEHLSRWVLCRGQSLSRIEYVRVNNGQLRQLGRSNVKEQDELALMAEFRGPPEGLRDGSSRASSGGGGRWWGLKKTLHGPYTNR